MRYLALGDSYTIGEGVPETGRWPAQLCTCLRTQGFRFDDPQIVATTGWATDELAAAIDAAALVPTYDLVSLLIGVNNQYRGRGIDNYRVEFEQLLLRTIELAGHRPQRVFVLSIPDWGVTAFGRESGRDLERIAREIDAFNMTAQQCCAERGVTWVDVTGLSRAHPSEVVEDGLHPSAQQYARWTEAAMSAAKQALAKM
ncbi:MAG TPA: SGNH/GDSL hydrolase family protein [Dyella sp.]|uniref:SGNH/GDSL hydrolase family protein n=1 Tax=Dyella sp. TaxID=1869338 RepID=UPI002F95D85D